LIVVVEDHPGLSPSLSATEAPSRRITLSVSVLGS
jgi:hypothetical protein